MTTYTIRRENAERDWDALRAILDNDGIVGGDVVVLEQIAKSIRAQIPKPAVAEPTELFSVVHASDAEGRTFNAVRVYEGAKRPWNSGAAWYGWRELHDAEVLRVGIGEQESADEWQRLHVANAQTEAYTKGAEDFATKVRGEIAALRSKVVTGPEKRTCDDLLALVGVLQGLS